MSEISKPDYTYLWSSGGSNVAPSNVKIQTGWIAEVPPFQWENWSQNRQDQAIAHVLQHGLAVWDSLTEYQAGKSYVQGSNGRSYIAVQTHTNQNPVTDTSEVYWGDLNKGGHVVLSAAGITSWTVPTILKMGIKKPIVTVTAGGGAGGVGSAPNRGAGGGGGGTSIKLVDLAGVTTVSATVGAGGAFGSLNGGASSFGAFCSATGGIGGSNYSGSIAAGGGGGVGINGDINIQGGYGSDAPVQTGAGIGGSGDGGASFYGGGMRSATGAGIGGALGAFGSGAGGTETTTTQANSGVITIRW